MKNSNDTIGNRTRDLPTCRAVCHQYETQLKYLTILSVYPQYKFQRNLFINSKVINIRTDGRKLQSLCAFNWHMNSELHKIVRLELRFVRSSSYTRIIRTTINPLKPELNPICYLLALLGAHHFLHVSRIRVKLLTFKLLMS